MAVLLGAAVAVQVAVPIVMQIRLIRDPETNGYAEFQNFGWQMYEGKGLTVRYVAIMRDRRRQTIDPGDVAGPFWGHVHYGSRIAMRLCAADPDRVTVTRYAEVHQLTERMEDDFRCP